MAMLNDIDTNRSKTIGDKSLPVSLTLQGVGEGSTASVTTEDGSFDLPNTKATTSVVAQVNVDRSFQWSLCHVIILIYSLEIVHVW